VIDTLTFSIAPLLDKPTGTSESYTFEGPAKFEEIATKSNITGKIEVMRIQEGLNIVVKDTEISIQFECEKCLKSFTTPIKIDFFEKQFYLNRPKKIQDPFNLFLVDKKHLTIDITEPLRQEIILHFPTNQVCSTHCKGICPQCGKDKNKKKCKCKVQEPEDEQMKPLSQLKKLLK